MTILKIFGFGIIWCIFGCGCTSSRPQQINFENSPQYYLALYTESQINKIEKDRKSDWKSAKHSNINANKFWKAYLVARLNGERDDGLRNSDKRQK